MVACGIGSVSSQSHPEVADILCKYGADVNMTNDTGKTALAEACYDGNHDMVKVLLKYGADIGNCLHISLSIYYPDIVKTLLSSEHVELNKVIKYIYDSLTN